MVTRCPLCATLFRVTPQQLQARQGQVRCGRCMKVFDGFAALATLPDEAQPASAPSETVPPPGAESAVMSAADESTPAATQAQGAQGSGAPQTSAPPPAFPPGAEFEFEPIQPRPARAVPEAAPPIRPAALRPETRPESAAASSPPVSADALFLEQAHARRRGGSRVWTVGSLLLALTLTGQAVYFYRGELAANYRGLKPLIVQTCWLLQCSVPLPQRPRLINIEASDLQSVDPARPGLIQLTATLRNHAGYDLAYPALDLVLTNTKEHTLARRIFLPHEYLEKGKDAGAGFPANAEITVRLDLDTGELGAAGFRLDLLPAR